MKLLHINSSPRDGKSNTLPIATVFLQKMQSRYPGLEIETIHLWRNVRFPRRPTDGRSIPWESWDVRLRIPGAGEPLFLGEWGLRAESLEEIERWRQLFPSLRLEEEDMRPDIRRAPL